MAQQSNKQTRPDRSQLLFLKSDKTFRWLMEQVKIQFPKWPSSLPPKSLEQAHAKAAEQAVLEAINRLLGDEI